MKKEKIMVLGSAGMAGHVVTTFFEEKTGYEVSNLAHTRKLNEKSYLMDVSDFNSFGALLDQEVYDVIINCIGLLNQYADIFKGKAILLNSYLPHFLEEKYRGSHTKIIHVSTDCVFSGKAGTYAETAFKDGDSSYDRTKAIGEITGDRNLTIRTSIIGPDMNPGGIGLFNWFMKSEGEINGYANSIWTGVTTLELAKAMESMIHADTTGIYHLVSGKAINKYELLLLFKEVFKRSKVSIRKYDNPRIDKSLVNTRSDFHYEVPDYPSMLSEMKEWMLDHRGFYPHYDL